jgi:alpha-ketoglutarate-dependent taurine dioxygenase
MANPWFEHLGAAGLSDTALADLIARRMGTLKVLRVSGAAPKAVDPRDFWQRMGETLGRCAQILEDSITGEEVEASGGWMDVRFEPDRLDTYRHANVGQPLHCDTAYGTALQNIGLFYLEKQASRGGESLFVSAQAVTDYVGRADPGLLARLFATEVKFGKGRACRTTPILRQSSGGVKINWNWFRVLSDQGEGVAALREDFKVLLERMILDEDAVMAFRLDEGDAVFFRDDEVLHGRKAYDAAVSGDRLLWKTYFVSPEAEAAAHRARAA